MNDSERCERCCKVHPGSCEPAKMTPEQRAEQAMLNWELYLVSNAADRNLKNWLPFAAEQIRLAVVQAYEETNRDFGFFDALQTYQLGVKDGKYVGFEEAREMAAKVADKRKCGVLFASGEACHCTEQVSIEIRALQAPGDGAD